MDTATKKAIEQKEHKAMRNTVIQQLMGLKSAPLSPDERDRLNQYLAEVSETLTRVSEHAHRNPKKDPQQKPIISTHT